MAQSAEVYADTLPRQGLQASPTRRDADPRQGAQHVPDFLGRVPIPLRLAFKAGVDKAVARHRSATGKSLWAQAITGGEWFSPFASVMGSQMASQLPNMLVVTCSAELLNSRWLQFYRGGNALPLPAYDPKVVAAGLPDPQQIFRLFAIIPFVLLVDERRLAAQGLALPTHWESLLDPCYRRQIVFGGWRPEGATHYEECNRFLLLCLLQAFGPAGIRDFAANVRALWHHVQIARDFAHPAHADAPAIAILPWAQAGLCPRREHTRIIWPAEGAYTMPLAFMLQPGQAPAMAPLIDYLCGDELGELLWRNGYPPAFASPHGALPEEASLSWPGWQAVRSQDMAAQSDHALETFFSCWQP